MELKKINSHSELLISLQENEKSYLLLYKSGAEQSECAINNLQQLNNNFNTVLYSADVKEVRDIHEKYGITSVPTLLEFNKIQYIKSLKGCHEPNFFKSVFENSVFVSQTKGKEDKKPQKRVTVYSTPTCSWCTRLKNYLKNNNIKFRDIDVSKSQKEAEAMAKRSGQRGVPQTDINGQMIVGFDKPKINKLLGI